MSPGSFLSCDWGTSSFRLRWIEPGLRVAREKRSGAGCKSLHDLALAGGENRAAFYQRFLKEELREWEGLADYPLPLVISGMASSTVGWQEVPYLKDPLKVDGSNLRFERISWDRPDWIAETFLISGVAIESGMMRGEETETIGIMAALEEEQGTLVLPGTHSKHLRVERGRVTGISTYMTGELFDLLARESLLKASVAMDRGTPAPVAFESGVAWAKEHGLAKSLFRVRTRAVLDRAPATENGWFLSGLLIGSEMHEAAEDAVSRIMLAGSGELGELYARALTALAVPSARWMVVPGEIVHRAVIAAHAMFLHARL